MILYRSDQSAFHRDISGEFTNRGIHQGDEILRANFNPLEELEPDEHGVKWRPASELPDWAIRRRVTVRQVKARMVSTITEDEAMAAGFTGHYSPAYVSFGEVVGPDGAMPHEEFRDWWDSAFPAHPWASDPWAWRVCVERVNKE